MSKIMRCPGKPECSERDCPHYGVHAPTHDCDVQCSIAGSKVCEVHGTTLTHSTGSEDERSMDFHEGWVKGFNAGKRLKL